MKYDLGIFGSNHMHYIVIFRVSTMCL